MPESSVPKYQIKIRFEVEGVVERADVVGAVFGQTEGLFGPEMNLHELQKNWKVGRIDIRLESKNGRTHGEVIIPMSTDMSTAAVIAAAIENIDKVGPCIARFQLDKIEDVRALKRKYIAERAKEIMKQWASKTTSESTEILKEVTESTKPARITTFGKEKLPAGPGVYTSNDVYVVEGRADVLMFLKAGIENVVAVEGTKVPESIKRLSKEKKITAVLDGDRGGELIEKELRQVADLQKVLHAPAGKEVEDLTTEEIIQLVKPEVRRIIKPATTTTAAPSTAQPSEAAAAAKEKPEAVAAPPAPPAPKLPAPLVTKIKEVYKSIDGTLESVILDAKMKPIVQIPVNQLVEQLGKQKNAKTVVFDGIITQRLVDASESVGVKTLVGHRVGDLSKKPADIAVATFEQLGL
ncbi:MAG: DNA primase DnaG [Thaumarchaeota archaeon]|nr:DNA primase DnaG [Nitrososphaerota archaeon]MCL5317688.1 DNA primase DnaG [Nitrososphaerota archaeon]